MYKIPLENLILEIKDAISKDNKNHLKIISNSESTKPLTDLLVQEKILFYVEEIVEDTSQYTSPGYNLDLKKIKIITNSNDYGFHPYYYSHHLKKI